MKCAAVVPAYNEEHTIANVVRALVASPQIHEVIVVSDGSTNNTAAVAAKMGAIVVNLPENRGKGGAMLVGIKQTDADYILFMDADLIGLRSTHIQAMLEPIKTGRVEMTLGLFKKGRKTTDLAQKFAPFLSGQRVIKTSLLKEVQDMDISRFGVELALTRFIEEREVEYETVELKDLSHIMKEEKLGFWRGIAARLKMYREIIVYLLKN